MRCESVMELLEEYIEGELDESRQAMIKTHLADCESCRRELALSRNITHLVSSLPTPPVPEEIIPNTLMQLRKSPSIRWQWTRYLRWRFAVVSLLMVIFLFGIGYQKLSNREQNEQVSISSANNNPQISAIENKLTPINNSIPLLSKNQQKSNSHIQRKSTSHLRQKKHKMTEKEIASAVEEVKLAFGIVETATEGIHLVALTEGTRAIEVTKGKYLDTMQAVSRYQSEFFVKLQHDLNIFGEVNEQ